MPNPNNPPEYSPQLMEEAKGFLQSALWDAREFLLLGSTLLPNIELDADMQKSQAEFRSKVSAAEQSIPKIQTILRALEAAEGEIERLNKIIDEETDYIATKGASNDK